MFVLRQLFLAVLNVTYNTYNHVLSFLKSHWESSPKWWASLLLRFALFSKVEEAVRGQIQVESTATSVKCLPQSIIPESCETRRPSPFLVSESDLIKTRVSFIVSAAMLFVSAPCLQDRGIEKLRERAFPPPPPILLLLLLLLLQTLLLLWLLARICWVFPIC